MLASIYLAASAIWSLGEQPNQQADIVSTNKVISISGHISNAPIGDTVRLYYANRQAKTIISSNGDFILTLHGLSSATFALFEFANKRTSQYLTPGDQLHLSLDFQRFHETLAYTGRGANANNYLAQTLWQFEIGPAGSIPRPREQVTNSTTAVEMRQFADTFRQQREIFLATYTRNYPLSKLFIKEALRHIELQWGANLAGYPSLYKYRAQQPALLPSGYFDFISKLHLQTLDDYRERHPEDDLFVHSFLTSCGYSSYLAPSGILGTDSMDIKRVYSIATTDFGKGRSRDQLIFQFLWSQLDQNNIQGVIAALPTFKSENSDSIRGRNLREMVHKQWLLRPGQFAPNFTLHDNTGRSIALNDLRGKVVYLDFWGTWCAPCIAQMPAMAALKQKFAGRDVVFVYISVRDKEEKWQQVLKSEQYIDSASVHLRSIDYNVPLQYDVREFPTYVLIGRDGRIQLTRAPRPTSGQIIVSAIEKALQD